ARKLNGVTVALPTKSTRSNGMTVVLRAFWTLANGLRVVFESSAGSAERSDRCQIGFSRKKSNGSTVRVGEKRMQHNGASVLSREILMSGQRSHGRDCDDLRCCSM